jgi:predicted lipoprotein with Yx(FWY)xxD motif
MLRTLFVTTLAAVGFTLAGCGGGGSGGGMSPPVTNPMPVAPTVPSPMPVATNSPAPTSVAGDAKTAQINGQTILVDANSGLALYTFGGDGPNQSNCTGGCLAIWPAHAATAGEQASGNFTIFTRPDGTLQWAYKGHPLYTFVSDTVSKNATGNGFQGFFLATP